MHNNYESKLKNIARHTLRTVLKVYSGAFKINASLSAFWVGIHAFIEINQSYH